MTSLYKLTQEFQQLADMDAGDDVGFAEALSETLNAGSELIDEKIESTVMVIRQLEADAETCEAEAKRLQDRAKSLKRNAVTCKERILGCMQALDRKTVKRPLFTVSQAKGRQSVAIDDENALPDEYVVTKTTTAPDKRLLLERLKGGEIIEGCHLDEGSPTLRVK